MLDRISSAKSGSLRPLHDYSTTPIGLIAPVYDANQMMVLNTRYLATKPDGTLETTTEFLWRVAYSVARAEERYAGHHQPYSSNGKMHSTKRLALAHTFYEMMRKHEWLPNTPCLVNAGRPLGALSACYVLAVPDDMAGIADALKAQALIQKSGGGTGFSFSDIREENATVKTTGRGASGPVSFIKPFDAMTNVIKQGGIRRGANMGVLRINHPDILKFMRCKKELDAENTAHFNRLVDSKKFTAEQLVLVKQEMLQTQFANFNFSIGITRDFMNAVEKLDGSPNDENWMFSLRDNANKHVKYVQLTELWDAIVEGAWQNGEPGLLFLDHPKANPLPGLGPIKATNPCLVAGTMVLTKYGHYPIEELVGQTVEVWDGEAWVDCSNFRVTGEDEPVYDVTLHNGQTITATAYHKFVLDNGYHIELRELKIGDRLMQHNMLPSVEAVDKVQGAYLKGFMVGDGHIANGKPHLFLYTPKYVCEDRLINSANELESKSYGTYEKLKPHFVEAGDDKRRIMNGLSARRDDVMAWGSAYKERLPSDIYNWSRESKADFIAGVMDADGGAMDNSNGFGYQIWSIHKEWLKDFQLLLMSVDVRSKIGNGKAAHAGIGKLEGYECQQTWRLTISQVSSIALSKLVTFERLKSFAGKTTKNSSDAALKRQTEIVEVKLSHVADKVYCCTIESTHEFALSNGVHIAQCGEQFLHANDSCTLGSVNLGAFYDEMTDDLDWARLRDAVKLGTRFLDNVLDENEYALPEIKAMVQNNRRVGQGLMGFADLLAKMGIDYGTDEAVNFAETIGSFMFNVAMNESQVLGITRGSFPNKHLSVYAKGPAQRNSAVLSIAPTGSIGMISGVDGYGCEPFFAIAYTKHVMKDAKGKPKNLYFVVKEWEKRALQLGLLNDELLGRIAANNGSVQGLGLPDELVKGFAVAGDVSMRDHVRMLCAFQKYVDNAVSKTINAPNNASRKDVADAILEAYRRGAKGMTVYRDGSRTEQVVTLNHATKEAANNG